MEQQHVEIQITPTKREQVYQRPCSKREEGAAGGTEEVTNTESVFNVTDKEIAKAFDENEVSANLKYENKVGTVTGKIITISKDFGAYNIMLDGGDFTGIVCRFDGDVLNNLQRSKLVNVSQSKVFVTVCPLTQNF